MPCDTESGVMLREVETRQGSRGKAGFVRQGSGDEAGFLWQESKGNVVKVRSMNQASSSELQYICQGRVSEAGSVHQRSRSETGYVPQAACMYQGSRIEATSLLRASRSEGGYIQPVGKSEAGYIRQATTREAGSIRQTSRNQSRSEVEYIRQVSTGEAGFIPQESGGDVEKAEGPGFTGQSSKRLGPPAPSYFLPPERHYISVLIPFIVVVNVIMFIVTMCFNNCPKNTGKDKCFATFLGRISFQPFGENPLLGPSSQILQKLGALDTKKVQHEHQGWRLITCIWLHAGVIHVLANMLSVLVVGIRLEQESGYLKIAAIYLLSGFGGSLLSVLFIQNQISVGASGALFGLLGAMLSEIITNWTIYTNKCAALSTLILVVGVNLGVGILPHVDNFAHIGGFITGFLLGFVLLVKPQYGWVNKVHLPMGYDAQFLVKKKHKIYQYIFWVLALVALIAGFSAALTMVFRGVDGNKECSWCHYMSCVPTSHWKCDDNAGVCDTFEVDNGLEVTCISNNKTTMTSLDASASMLSDLCVSLCN